MKKYGTALIAASAVLAFLPAAAKAADSVPASDWSYSAVQDLAGKGLINGYPKDKNLFQGRTVTRYEMAALVQRAITRLVDDQAAGTTPPPTTLDEMGKLIAEYKVELAVMGTDIENLKLGVSTLTDTVLDQQNQLNKLNKTKVDTGAASGVKFSALLQEWAAAGTDVANTGKNPGAISNTYRIRRAELRFQGNIDPKTYFNVMFDPSKNLSLIGTTKVNTIVGSTSTVSTTTYSVNENGLPLQDFFLGYKLTPQFAAELGQQKVPMSIEGYARSSGNLLTVERSLMNTVPFDQGRVGDIRDLGATFRYTQPNAGIATLAVMNDAGALQNFSSDNNNSKDVMYSGQITAVPGLMFGGWGELPDKSGLNSTSAANASPTTPNNLGSNVRRSRNGVDFDFIRGPHELTGEYEKAYDGDNTAATVRQNSQSAYGIYAYKVNPQWQAVVRYDWFNIYQTPIGGSLTSNNEHDVTLGVNYYIKGNNSKIQFNYVRKNIDGPLTAPTASTVGPTLIPALGVSRDEFYAAFQQSF